jgi:hypothetical protein
MRTVTPSSAHQRPGQGVPGGRAAGGVGGCEEEGAGRGVQERRPRVPAQGLAGAGERARLHGQGPGQGDPLRDLRPVRERRLGIVGTDHDTSAFAVVTLRTWWDTIGKARYPSAVRLLICADGGGSNGYRVRTWKIELAKLAAETGLQITVCHLPPGTSKWNKIEHRLFSQITLTGAGGRSPATRSSST